MFNLKEEYKRIKSLGDPCTGADVSRAYSGLPTNKNRTITQTPSTVIRLHDDVLAAIGDVSNG